MFFFDTNILVYTVDTGEPLRQAQAREILAKALLGRTLMLSTQVLLEFYNTMLRRKLVSPQDAVELMRLWTEHEVVNSSADMLFRAFALHQSRRWSVWDSLIVQAALDAGCTTLYTEDLQHGLRIGELEIVNPFLQATAVHEPAAAYAAAPRRRRGK
jgi:predicted nucleic acid-binding protein